MKGRPQGFVSDDFAKAQDLLWFLVLRSSNDHQYGGTGLSWQLLVRSLGDHRWWLCNFYFFWLMCVRVFQPDFLEDEVDSVYKRLMESVFNVTTANYFLKLL